MPERQRLSGIFSGRNVIARRMADEYLRQRDVRPKVCFELDGIDNIARLVPEGLGVSVQACYL